MPDIFLDDKKYEVKNILGCGNGLYRIPELDVHVDVFSWYTFHRGDKAFKLVRKKGQKHYKLQPMKKFRNYCSEKTRKGAYGNITFLPVEQVAVKYFKKAFDTDLPQDMVKEVAIYSMLKSFRGTPILLGLQCGDRLQNRYIALTLGVECGQMSCKDFYPLAFNLVKYLRAVSEQGIIHCDIKPTNCVLSREGEIQLIDWGLAEIDYSLGQKRKKDTVKQTLWYRSPELLIESPTYSYKADIFSLGITFLEFFFGNVVSTGKNAEKQSLGYVRNLLGIDPENGLVKMKELVEGPPLSEKIESSLRDNFGIFSLKDNQDGFFGIAEFDSLLNLISQMLDFNPDNRIDYVGILHHPFFDTERRKIRLPLFPVFINRMPRTTIPECPIRRRLFEWIGRICRKKKFSLNSLCLAFQIYDLYPKFEKKGKEIAISCLSIATKIFESPTRIMSIREQSWECLILENGFAMPLELAEGLIMTKLKGDVLRPSLYSYRCRKYGLGDSSIDKYVSAYLRPDIYERDFRDVMDNLDLE